MGYLGADGYVGFPMSGNVVGLRVKVVDETAAAYILWYWGRSIMGICACF